MLDDLRGKVNAQLKAAVRKLRDNPDCGKILGGALKGCQSLRIEDSEKRVVYRQVESAGRTVVEIIAIDNRRDNEVYDSAEQRLSK